VAYVTTLPCGKLAADACAKLAASKRPVGHLGGYLLRNIADDVDFLVQTVAHLLNVLQLLGRHDLILVQALQLLSIVGLSPLQLVGNLADGAYFLP
jgi:hypothetical protein